jgi:hypothetical protein
MNKKDLSKAFTGGAVKQRALLLAEDIALQRMKKKRILTEEESRKIWESFKTPYEKKVWNEIREVEINISEGLNLLMAVTFEVLYKKANLKGTLSLWGSFEESEEIANFILYEIKDLLERKRIADLTVERSRIAYGDLSVDPEGFIKVSVGDKDSKKKYTVWSIIELQRGYLIESYKSFNGLRQAILDYQDETGVHLKTYKDRINEYTLKALDPAIDETKYSPNKLYKGREGEIIKYYQILPDPNKLGYSQESYDLGMRNLKKEAN